VEKESCSVENLVKNFYKNKKVLITGVTGFKGAWLCTWLKKLDANILGIGFNPNKNKNLFYSLKLNKEIKLHLLDVKNIKKLRKTIFNFKPEIIFHLAAQPLILTSYKKPYLTFLTNTVGTLNILESIKDANFVRSVICVTSDKCYQNNFSKIGFKESDKLGGDDPYSASKASTEIVVNSYYKSFFKDRINKIGIASARAGNVIGGGDLSENRLIPDAIRSLIRNKIIKIRNPKFNRPWQHVLEPLYGYLLLGCKLYHKPNLYSGAWNFGTKKNNIFTVKQIVENIIKFWGSGEMFVSKNFKFYEQENLQLNINKSKIYLNWKPKLSVTESIKLTVEWYKKVLVEKCSSRKITNDQIDRYINEY